jgi:glutathione S-transferase
MQNNLPIDVHEIDILKGETKTDEFTKLNPHQAVPVLKDRDVVVRERYTQHCVIVICIASHVMGR